MPSRFLALLVLWLTIIKGESRCGERLERALDLMQQRGSGDRRRYDSDETDAVYHQRLRSAPIDVSITKLFVEIPHGGSRDGHNLAWAKVERCMYEPSSHSIRSRVGFSELAVAGLVQLRVASGAFADGDVNPGRAGAGGEDDQSRRLLPAEACRMSLRLRRAGMEFYTSPIARGRGQMRIRTESSFLEPRFASIYAYGCRPMLGPVAVGPGSDRVESEPRKREIGRASSLGGLADNSVNATIYQDDDPAEDEDRLSSLASSRPPGAGPNDALLDSLWRSRSDIAREMEDVFLRSASQAITHYIERQLHPAIKETLMTSMGYTVSYG